MRNINRANRGTERAWNCGHKHNILKLVPRDQSSVTIESLTTTMTAYTCGLQIPVPILIIFGWGRSRRSLTKTWMLWVTKGVTSDPIMKVGVIESLTTKY